MKPKTIPLLEQCIANGIILGQTRATKHNEHPTTAQIREAIERAIMEEIHEWFSFEPEES